MVNRNTTHGMSRDKTYFCWQGMKNRCKNKNDVNYKNWGGRGIKICDEWMKFENFYRDMCDRPEGKTLDRIDNNKGYCKENCRWATPKEQLNNKRNNRLLTFNGRTMTVSQWSRNLNIPKTTIFTRLQRGWDINRALQNKNFKFKDNK